MSYLTQPIIYPDVPAARARKRLRSMIRRARAATTHDESLRIGIIGDSTTTSPGGAGVAFHHALTAKLGGLFGNIAGTQITPAQSVNGAPFMQVSGNNLKAALFATTYNVPGMAYGGLPFATGEGSYQPAVKFESLTSYTWQQRGRLANTGLFPTANISLELQGLKNPGSADGIKVIWAPTDKRSAYLFATAVSNETISMGLDAANGGKAEYSARYRTALQTPAAGFEPQWYLQSPVATTAGVGSAAPPQVAVIRALNNNPVGCMIDCMSAGGYTTRGWFGANADGASALRTYAAPPAAQLKHDILFFAMAANDFYAGAGLSTATVAADLYSPTTGVNRGLIGELIKEYELREIPVPLIVIVTNPFRADSGGSYAAQKAQHDAYADTVAGLVDSLTARGYDAMMLNTYKYTAQRGFNAANNYLAGLTSKGAWSSASVVYAANDYVSVNGREYIATFGHTSTGANGPENNTPYWLPAAYHLLGPLSSLNYVHWSTEGSELIADSYFDLFVRHYDGTQITNVPTGDLVGA